MRKKSPFHPYTLDTDDDGESLALAPENFGAVSLSQSAFVERAARVSRGRIPRAIYACIYARIAITLPPLLPRAEGNTRVRGRAWRDAEKKL